MVEKLKNIGKKKKHSIETKKLWGRQLNCMFNVLYNHKSKGNLLGKKHENVYKKDDTITDEAF